MNTAVLILDFVSTFAFALVGVGVAWSKKMDYAGILFVASVSALSGGTFRNIALGVRPAWISQPYLLFAILSAILISWLFHHTKYLLSFAIFFDSVGLGFATIAGVNLSLHLHVKIFAAIVLGVLSGVLGGLVRDVLCQVPPVLLHRETNGTSSFIGATFFVILLHFSVNNYLAQGIALLLVVAIRLLSIRYQWNFPKPSR